MQARSGGVRFGRSTVVKSEIFGKNERGKSMFNTKRLFVPAALVLFVLLGESAALAKDKDDCYSAASVQGSWAVIATYGANVALALGRRVVSENGDFTATFVLNGPTPGSTTGARTITTGTQVGTYAVNCDGTGTITRTLTASNGVITTQVDDFVITKAIVEHGHLVATAIADAVEVPSALVPGGIFVTRVHTRLPSERDERP
jgi:hypothetical protein